MRQILTSNRRQFLRHATIVGVAGGASASESSAQGRGSMSSEAMADRLAIEELMVRYCYAIDDRDWDAYRAVFTADAIIDDTVTGGIRSGVEEHVVYLTRALSKIKVSQHAISTILVEIDGDEARARSHCSCPMVVDLGKGKTHVFLQGLWYRDRLVRQSSGWRFKERIEEGYWTHNLPRGFKF
jgi:hypothetical protein